MADMSFTFDTSHFEMSPLNTFVLANVEDISATLNTSHFKMPLLNDVARTNIQRISVTRETSQSPVSPCGPSEQSPFGDNFRYSSAALLSSALVCGENAVVPLLIGPKQLRRAAACAILPS